MANKGNSDALINPIDNEMNLMLSGCIIVYSEAYLKYRHHILLWHLSLRNDSYLLTLPFVHMAGYDETGGQQEAWRVFLCNCHNCSFDRDLPGLYDEVIILSVRMTWPYQGELDSVHASHVWELEKMIGNQMSSTSSPFCFVNIGVHV
jgi:hypothetical protein